MARTRQVRRNGNGQARAPATRALDPERQIIRIARSAAPGNMPTGLQEGELGVDMAVPPRLWVGCPPAVDASGLLQLHVAAGIAEPSTAGNFLRTNTGTWVPGLPLAGGTLQTVTDAGGGIVIDVNDTSWTHPGIGFNTTSGYGIEITTGTGSVGIGIHNNGGNAAEIINTGIGGGLYVQNSGAAGINLIHSGTGTGLAIGSTNFTGTLLALSASGAGGGIGLDINKVNPGNSLVVRNGATNHLVVAADGRGTITYTGGATALTINATASSAVGQRVYTGVGGTAGVWVDNYGISGFSVYNRSAATAGFEVLNQGTYGIQINNDVSANSIGIYVGFTAGAAQTSRGIYVHMAGASVSPPSTLGIGVYANNLPDRTAFSVFATGGSLFRILGDGSTLINCGTADVTALDINKTGTGNSFVLRNGATNHFVVAADGTITLSPQAVASLQAALGI